MKKSARDGRDDQRYLQEVHRQGHLQRAFVPEREGLTGFFRGRSWEKRNNSRKKKSRDQERANTRIPNESLPVPKN